MKFTYSWLLSHLDTTKTPQEIAEKLTSIGLEVDEFTNLGAKYAPFVIAEIVEATQHPNADRLRVCKVNDGTTIHQIVCGAPNARAGIKVIMAPIGALIPNGNFEIKKSKIRDVESCGMLCSADELELGSDSAGIVELPADAPVGKKYAEFASLNDSFYEIAITPNRQDCLGVRGVARDLAAAGYGEIRDARNEKRETNSIYWRSFKNVKNASSPAWLQARLKSIGLNPISALVDITNYLTFDLGRPAHVYDADKLQGNLRYEIRDTRYEFNALNDKTYQLENDFVIADDNGAVALAGVIGGAASGVDENTKNVVLEIAYFDPETVAKSGRKYQIDSDARYRFERGVDPEGLQEGLEAATKLIAEICGGEAVETKFAGEAVQWQREITFDFAKIKDLGGLEIPQAQAEQILQDLGFSVAGNKISPPSWRRDIEGQPDLVEEIIRIIGLDKIAPQMLPASDIRCQKSDVRNVKAQLAARGLMEVVTYSFTSEAAAEAFGGGAAELKLLNPISTELSTMRPSILPNLLEAAVRNANRGVKNLGLFEVGPVFTENSEQTTVTCLRVGKTAEKGIYGDGRSVDAFDAKADILAVLAALGAPENLQLREDAPAYYHPGRSAGLYLGKNCLGYFGEIHPQILKEFDCNLHNFSCVAFEVFVKNIPASKRKIKALEVSDLQAVGRDFAFTLAREIKVGEILRRVEKLDDLIVGAEVFDVYEGDKIDADKKSVAFSITLQPKTATLTDAEIETISSKVITFVENEFAGKLRA